MQQCGQAAGRTNRWDAAIGVDLDEPVLFLLGLAERDGMHLVGVLELLEQDAGFPAIWCACRVANSVP